MGILAYAVDHKDGFAFRKRNSDETNEFCAEITFENEDSFTLGWD